MNPLTHLTPEQLRRAADLQERIQSLQVQLNEILGLEGNASSGAEASAPRTGRTGGRRLSPEGLANIRAGVIKRMERMKALQASGEAVERPKRKVSTAARKKMAAAQRARRERERAQAQTVAA